MTKESAPLVSVITLIYNTGRFVVNTLDSIKNQTYPNIQHIIIDDCSKDNSTDLVEDWIKVNNYSCTFLKNPKNLGITKNCNRALEMVQGEFMTYISDDIMLPNRVEDAVNELTDNPAYAMLYSDAEMIDEDYKTLYPSYVSHVNLATPAGDIFVDFFNRKVAACAPTFFYRTALLKGMNGFDEQLKTEDWDSMLKITKKNLVYFSPTKNIQYLIRSGSSSATLYNSMAMDRLLVLEKWLTDPEVGEQVPQLALNYLASCYAKNDKAYAKKWISLLKGKLNVGPFNILSTMIKLNLNGKIVLGSSYLLKKLKVI